MRLGEILVQSGRITGEQLQAALQRQASTSPPRRIGDLLVEAGACSRHEVLVALGRQYHLEVLSDIPANAMDHGLIERLPVDWARRHLIFPLRVGGEVVAVMADPSALNRLEELSILIGEEITGALASEESIRRAIDEAYFERKRPTPTAGQPAASAADAAVRGDDLLRESDSAPVTQLINAMILEAVRRKASDIHIEPYERHLRVRFRIDGMLYEQAAPPKQWEQPLISRIKVMSRLDIAERRLPQDGMARVRAGEREIDIRVSTVPTAEGERVVLRLLNQSSALLPLAELGMPSDILARFNAAKALPNGIILVTGPTGSGKTTTLYAALQDMDTSHRNVMTIEDPIEYQIANIGQIQVKPKIGLTFAAGLRHILRQDPDVILVGEIRDQETAEIAVRAALTGHLVFSTLHTNDAASAVIRLADMGVPPYLIASSVRAILAQRLVRRLCPSCRREQVLTPAELASIPARWRGDLAGRTAWTPVGCPACLQGYRGRVGIYELFMLGPAEQEAMRRPIDLGALRAMADAQGSSMWSDAVNKIRAGVVSIDDVLRVIEPGTSAVAP